MRLRPSLMLGMVVVALISLLSGCSGSASGASVSSQNQQSGTSVTLPSFADLIDKAQPSVVAVNTQTVVRTRFVQRTVQGAGSDGSLTEAAQLSPIITWSTAPQRLRSN